MKNLLVLLPLFGSAHVQGYNQRIGQQECEEYAEEIVSDNDVSIQDVHYICDDYSAQSEEPNLEEYFYDNQIQFQIQDDY